MDAVRDRQGARLRRRWTVWRWLFGFLTSAELYDRASGTLPTQAAWPRPLRSHRDAPAEREGARGGGVGPFFVSWRSSVALRPASGSFALTGALNRPRRTHGDAFENGKVLVVGGFSGLRCDSENDGRTLRSTERDLQHHGADVGAARLPDSNALPAAGADQRGFDCRGQLHRTAGIYDPLSGTSVRSDPDVGPVGLSHPPARRRRRWRWINFASPLRSAELYDPRRARSRPPVAWRRAARRIPRRLR